MAAAEEEEELGSSFQRMRRIPILEEGLTDVKNRVLPNST